MYDVAIIGTGPAGISAALNLSLHNKKIIWFGSANLSAKVEKSEKIANYPGVSLVKGPDLNELFLNQIKEAGLTITDRMVTNIVSRRKGFMVLGGNDYYEAKTVLLATGSVSAKGFEGEHELLGHGVSYCATCDGYLYKDKTMAVFCQDKHFEHEVEYLAELAEKVYLFTSYKNCQVTSQNVIRQEAKISKICGQDKVNGLELNDGSKLSVDAAFILRNAVAPAQLVKGVELDGSNIVVDRNMATTKKGCFAAGDCTGAPYQITKAVGEGNIAAHSIVKYLSDLEKAGL